MKDIVIPIGFALTLLVQSGTLVWWASGINSAQNSLIEFRAEQQQEQLRQWARINQNESNIQSIQATTDTNQAILSRVEGDLKILRGELGNTNDLLRDILIDGTRNDE